MALKDILIQHLSKDLERQTRVVEEVNEEMGGGINWMRVLEARRLILSECCSGLILQCSFFFPSRLLYCSVFLL